MNDIWDSLDPGGEMTAYDTGLTLSPAQLMGPMGGNFPAEAFLVPEPIEKSWLGSIWEPFGTFGQDLWQVGKTTTEQVAERIPDLLFGWGLRQLGAFPEQREVSEGAGVTVIHTQAPHAGGEPAQPGVSIIPGQWPTIPSGLVSARMREVAQKAQIPVGVMLAGAGILVLYFVTKR